MRPYLLVFCLIWVSCAHNRVNDYRDRLSPHVGKTKKATLDEQLGAPVRCEPARDGLTRCEYRVSAGKNHPVPGVYRKNPAMGPDVSPYEYFDELNLYYDGDEVLKEWTPGVIR